MFDHKLKTSRVRREGVLALFKLSFEPCKDGKRVDTCNSALACNLTGCGLVLYIMTTRLDRILNLLATGSNASVKATAARQLGSIAASASRKGDEGWIEVVQLLTRIIPFLHHKQLETRVAAGKAVEAVCSDCGLWSREEDVKPDLDDVTSALDAFDLAGLLSSAQTLLASSGTEYKDLGQQAGTSSKKDVLSNLGLAGFGDDAFLDDELGTELDAKSPLKATKETPLSPVPMESEPDTKNLSARERNALKRKRKNDTKAPSTKYLLFSLRQNVC